jgi:hypothetical protein
MRQVIESANPKLEGIDGARLLVEYLFELADV